MDTLKRTKEAAMTFNLVNLFGGSIPEVSETIMIDC